MKLNDALIGALLALLGTAVLWQVQSFPAIPGQRFGAALFPGVVAVGLVACGALLVLRGWRQLGSGEVAALSVGPLLREPRSIVRLVSVPAGILLYILLSGWLGFHLTAGAIMLGWMLLFGTRLPIAAIAAIVLPLALHFAFYKLLRVPLPWGVMQHVVFGP
ncbi:MAG: tripartite tricarboxylate transporter TctB family protein [Alphaproteobacteria bacterium]|nr:tripartite tricarboxylate transporter TctB family protein [Alphaproteobacteria bacterium]